MNTKRIIHNGHHLVGAVIFQDFIPGIRIEKLNKKMIPGKTYAAEYGQTELYLIFPYEGSINAYINALNEAKKIRYNSFDRFEYKGICMEC